jgi:AGZA family xanthine/uracil permease-like MFS transporter
VLEKIFCLSENGTDVRTEVLAGTATFMTMAYIIFVNPAILSAAGIPFSGAVTATCLAGAGATLIMAFSTNYPFALAPGMGLNAFLVFGVIIGMRIPWQVGMAVIFIEGVIILILVLTGLREAVMHAIPLSLKQAIGVGIGIFIALIGLNQGGIIRPAPITLVTLGDFTQPYVLVALFGIVVIAGLRAWKVRGDLLWGILLTTVFALLAGIAHWPDRVVQPWDLATVGAVFGGDGNGPYLVQALHIGLWTTIFAIMMSDFFDTMGSVIALGMQAGYVRDGKLPRIKPVLVADSLAASIGGLFGASSVTTYIESAAGIAEGGRTGLATVVTALLFLFSAFFAPLAAMIGGGYAIPNSQQYSRFFGFTPPGGDHYVYPITAGALVVVGFLMMRIVKEIPFDDFEESFPAFLTIIGVPLTYSISHGIGLGFVSYTLIKAARGKFREVHPLLYVVSLAFAATFVIHWINGLIG